MPLFYLCLSTKHDLRILIRAEQSISPGVLARDPHPGVDKSKHIVPYINYKTAPGETLFEYFLNKGPAHSPAWMFN